jgi:hypothetical protein
MMEKNHTSSAPEYKQKHIVPRSGTALCPSKSGLMNKHIVKLGLTRVRVAYDWMRV